VNKKRIGTNRIGSEAGKTEKGRALEPFFFIAAKHKTEFTLLTQLVKRFCCNATAICFVATPQNRSRGLI
jgi:hypothetical protein